MTGNFHGCFTPKALASSGWCTTTCLLSSWPATRPCPASTSKWLKLPAILAAFGVGLVCFGWLQAKLSENRGRLESVAWTAMAFFGVQLVIHLYAGQLSPTLIGGLAIMCVAYPAVYAWRPRVLEVSAAMAFQMLLAAY